MATLGKLTWILDADSSKFQKGMKRASAAMRKLRTGFLVAAGAGGAMAAFVKSALNTADALGKTASTLGLTVKGLQELQYAADRSGVSQDKLNSNMTAFVKRVGEARAGMGPLTSFLKKYDTTLLSNIKNSKTQAEALDLLAEAVRNAETATDRAALANASFGRSGIDMVEMLKNGKDGMDEFRNAANENTSLLSKDMTVAAAKANDAISDLSKSMSSASVVFAAQFAPEIEIAAKGLQRFLNTLSKSGALGNAVKGSFQAVGSVMAGTAANAFALAGNQGQAARFRNAARDLGSSSRSLSGSAGSGIFDAIHGKNAGVGQMEFGRKEDKKTPQTVEDPKALALGKTQTTILMNIENGIKTYRNAPAVAG